MNDPTQDPGLGADFVLDEQERQATLSNEQIEEIQQRLDAAQEQELADTEQSMQPPTGGEPLQQQDPGPSTAEPAEASLFKNPDGSINYEALDAEAASIDKGNAERLLAIPTGMLDFGIETFNWLTGISAEQDAQYGGTGGLPKITKYEDNVAQAVRSISSVVAPTILLQGAGLAAGTRAQAVVNNPLGKSAFVKFMSQRGIEAGTSVAVGSVSDQYTEDNMMGMIKKSLPPQWDFIPDSWATLEGESTDEMRQKNINEDLALGFIIPFAGQAAKLRSALVNVAADLKKVPQIFGESDQAVKALADMRPAPKGKDLTEELTNYARKQEADLDELGYYNMSKNPEGNVAMKGVHDLYDWNETGMRSVDDFGIVGASVDAARIASNKGTVYGRLRNFISEPALKFGTETPGGVEEITIGLAKQLKDADRYRMDAADWAISFDEIQAQGDNLVLELFDPTVGVDEIRRILDPVITKNEFGAEVLSATGYTDALSSINTMVKNYSGMDVAKAQAYTATSIAGQIADLSEGIRINKGSLSVENAQEKLLDNINFLQQLVGSTRYYTTQKKGLLTVAEKIRTFGKSSDEIAEGIKEAYPQALRTIQNQSDEFTANWQYLQENRPDILDAFLEIYEISDGKINTIAKMNEDMSLGLTKLRLGLDMNPESPNILVQALRGNYFNSKLSNPATGIRALYGNLSGLVAEPITYFAGALARGDMKAVQRGWMAYSAIFDTQKKAIPYAGQMFRKASQNPNSVASQTRLDLIIQKEEKFAQWRYIAEAEAERGNHGYKFLTDLYEEGIAMAEDPIFRLQPNLMTGFDGWTGATVANAQARFRAMDELDRLGEAATPARVKELATAEYNSMFDRNGVITDQAVKYSTADIALNLDTRFVKEIDGIVKMLPWMQSLLTYPKMFMNLVRVGDDYLPLPFKSFQEDINDLAFTPVKDLMSNPELVDKLLTKRGHPIQRMDPTAKLNTIIDLKNRTLGRKAVGTAITSLVIGTVFRDKLFGDGLFSATGDGNFDRQLNRARIKNSNFKPRTVALPGGSRLEYEELLGPGLSNWVAFVANVVDNFDMLGETAVEHLFQKSAFILSAALAEPAGMSALSSLAELVGGNEAQMLRWSAAQFDSLGPLSGARRAFGEVLDGGYKELNNDLMSHLGNRNKYFGTFDDTNRLPTITNPITGEIPNQYSLFHRFYNQMSPLKIHPGMTKEEQFLVDIEYDVSSAFKTRDGIDLTNTERAALYKKMGEQQVLRKEISRISKIADARNTIKELKEARRTDPFNPNSSKQIPIGKYDQIHTMLRDSQKLAEDLAYEALDSEMKNGIQQRILIQQINNRNATQGIIPSYRN